jgi:GAF domain-containing protein
MGTVQLLEGGTLYLRAQRGFGSKFLQHFEAVDKHDTYAWGTALRDKILTAINDVQADARFAEHRNAAALGNFRAALSAPLISPRGQPLGVVSVYFPHPTRFSASDLEAFQRHAERSAAAIDWALV